LALGVRLTGWGGAALKLYFRGGNAHQALALAFKTLPPSFLPLFGMFLGTKFYTQHRRKFVCIANAINFWQVPQYYHYLYPINDTMMSDISTIGWLRAFVALFSANGVVFLVLTTFMGGFIFKYLFLAQYVNLTILLLNNKEMCRQGYALQKGYMLLSQALKSQIYLPKSSSNNSTMTSDATFATNRSSVDPLQLCISYQLIVQIVFGFLIPAVLAFSRERGIRRAFLASKGISSDRLYPSTRDLVLFFPAMALPWLVIYLTQHRIQ